MGSGSQRRLLVYARMALMITLLAGIGLLWTAPQSASAQTSTTNGCIYPVSGYHGCTANDTSLADFTVLRILDGCTSPSDTFTALVQAQTRSTAKHRYDIGIWVNLDGTDAITGASCYRQMLAPVVSSPFPGLNLNGGSGPYRNEDGDMCGDIYKDETNIVNLPALTFACADPNGDGFVDVNSCVSWDNNAKGVCSSVADALPSTQSKCRCNTFRVDVSVPNLSLTKSCTPNQVMPGGALNCTITYTNNGKGDAIGFSLVDNYDQANGAVANITKPHLNGDAGVDNGDTIIWQLPPILKNGGSGSVSYTYTVKPTAQPNTQIKNTATIYFGNAPQAVTAQTTTTVLNPGSITIAKQTTPSGAPGAFPFTSNSTPASFDLNAGGSQAFTRLPAGNYTFAELAPAGWQLTNIACSGGTNSSIRIGASGGFDPGDSTLNINLSTGEQLLCTFTNTALGKIRVIKETDPAHSPQAFTFTPSYNNGLPFTLTDGQQYDSGPLLPGTYSVAATMPPGWSQTGVSCSDGSSPTALNLAPAETIICTFSSAIQRGNIVVVEQTAPSGAVQTFTFTPSYGANFSLTDGQSNTSAPLLPSSEASPYAINEQLPSGWNQTSVTCSDGSNPASIDVAPGETVTCTFNNATLPSAIGIVKSASQTLVAAGTAVTYGYIVTNQGQTVLSNISVSDDRCSPVNPTLAGGFNVGDADKDNALDLSEQWRFTCTTKIVRDTLNTATTSGLPPAGSAVTHTSSTFVDVRPTIHVTKTAIPTSVLETGGAVDIYNCGYQRQHRSSNAQRLG